MTPSPVYLLDAFGSFLYRYLLLAAGALILWSLICLSYCDIELFMSVICIEAWNAKGRMDSSG